MHLKRIDLITLFELKKKKLFLIIMWKLRYLIINETASKFDSH